jgi:hypothetical protein
LNKRLYWRIVSATIQPIISLERLEDEEAAIGLFIREAALRFNLSSEEEADLRSLNMEREDEIVVIIVNSVIAH